MQEYKQKYLKYKNKYLQLKNLIGGQDINAPLCNTNDKINLDILNIGDNLTFFFPQRNSITNFIFRVDANSGDIPISEKITLNSVETINGSPLLTIIFYKGERYSKLNFIRANKPIFTFDLLFSIYACVTRYFNYPRMMLEDDALFVSTDNIQYRALIYRIFMGKDSIYYGGELNFRPTKQSDYYYFKGEPYNDDSYQIDKMLLATSTISDFVLYFTELIRIVDGDYQFKRQTNRSLTPPYILEQIDKLLISLHRFGIVRTSREYIERMQDTSISIDEKENIKIFIDKLMPTELTTKHYNDQIKALILSNSLYTAAIRIHKSHQNMISTNVICSLC